MALLYGLIAGGLPYLVPAFSDRHWHVFRVRDATPLLSGAGVRLTATGAEQQHKVGAKAKLEAADVCGFIAKSFKLEADKLTVTVGGAQRHAPRARARRRHHPRRSR